MHPPESPSDIARGHYKGEVILEEILYRRTPSQAANLPVFLSSIVGFLLVAIVYPWLLSHWHFLHFLPKAIGLVLAGCFLLHGVLAYLSIALTTIEVNTERLTLHIGIANRVTCGVELHQVQNVSLYQPWWQRLFGAGTLLLQTSDSQYPTMRLRGLPEAATLREQIIQAATASRARKGIREYQMGRI